ncbi:Arginyl-tRNA synthetase [Candidatus Phaeomarinobacter ectocarpi]|uniref:Arginine--tRNA ligase n=1 Tax=Candidatus Phaeomarinibacter ectocarpi TaxID=1458461 RepID=X5MNF9_9HYPH|nr:arginine--tRNA ligase [Candidatus Phaeomarinobacter ectocarpi]CDO61225.1 Arginyl-tRNA synthetase [Candidatus Phaeomarinobacter ectocarpi]
MNLFSDIRAVLLQTLETLSSGGTLPGGLDLANVTVEPPRDPSHGDIATNAAMVLAKQAKMKPRDIADAIAAEITSAPSIASAEVAGPGFINLRLAEDLMRAQVKGVLEAGEKFGDADVGGGRKVNVEYVSANPTGPMHVGHCRGAIFGDALANLLNKAGYDVAREYYINDAGGQIEVLARSAFLRYREALGENIGEIPEGLYPGDYLVPVGKALADEHGKTLIDMEETAWLPIVKDASIDAMMAMIRDDLAALDIHHEVFFSERGLGRSDEQGSKLAEAIDLLEDKGLLYTGVLEPPKGKMPDDWEARPQLLFKATEFGDDVDRALKKSDGTHTYFAADIAYHLDKYRRGFNEMIDVWGADHGGYIKRMQAAVKALSDNEGSLDVKICQMVKLFRAGEPVKMSKRSGEFVTLRDVVDEVGRDVVRFMMLTRKNDAPLDFDFAAVMEQSKDNPVFYVQYAHARICSVLRLAGDDFPDADLSDAALATTDLSALDDDAELALIKLMAGFPRLVEQAALSHEPHRVAFYLQELAAGFHALWNKGKDDARLRFIHTDQPGVTMARLALIRAVALTLAAGLGILGVTPVKEMR